VKDAQGDSAYGRTNWRRFAVAVGVPTVIAGGLVIGLAQGAFAASFAISGQTFKISADKLDGTGFAQYGDYQNTAKTPTVRQVPVAMSGIKTAKLTKLCQSVLVPGTKISLTIRAGDDPNNPAVATDMLIGMSDLSGEATFTNINIGQDASTLTKGGEAAVGHPTFFGQEADGVIITGLHQTAYSTTAGTFKLTGLRLNVNLPDSNGNAVECY
jgi:hypothetical protein